VEHERALRGAVLGCENLAYEESVVAGLVLGDGAAAEPGYRPVQLGRAVRAAQSDPLPQRDRRDSAGEVLRECFLADREHAHRELARLPKQLVQRCVPPHRDPYERWVERERDERRDRQADALPVELDGDDGHAGREPSHDRAKLLAADHAGDHTSARNPVSDTPTKLSRLRDESESAAAELPG
jgi:hypothetical protein